MSRGLKVLAVLTEQLATLGLAPDEPIWIGCSGGNDSVALGYAAVLWARNRPVTLVHVNHGLRSTAAQDAEFVEELAQEWGVGYRLLRADVKPGASLENAARDARYAAFTQAMTLAGQRWLALAHTADDQAETIFMRMVRGTGSRGLAGIPARRDGFFRPLLTLDRATLEEFRKRHGQPCISDEMNGDLRFFRSRVRLRWLPELGLENPHVKQALCRIAASHREDEEYWQGELQTYRAQWDRVKISATAIQAFSPALGKRILQAWLLANGAHDLTYEHIAALWTLISSPIAGTQKCHVPGGIAVRVYDDVRFDRHGVTTQRDTDREEPPSDLVEKGQVRLVARGDRMTLPRLKGHSRKIFDLLGDAKVPRELRPSVRVVEASDGKILWAEFIGRARPKLP